MTRAICARPDAHTKVGLGHPNAKAIAIARLQINDHKEVHKGLEVERVQA